MVSQALLADLLDKNPPPWAAFPIVSTLLAIVICVAPAVSRARVARIGAMCLATAWALFWLWWDDWFDPEIGPQMQALLGSKASLYSTLLWIEAILPAAA